MSNTYLTGYGRARRRRTRDELETWLQWKTLAPEPRRRFLALMDFCIDHGYDLGVGGTIRTIAASNAGYFQSHHPAQEAYVDELGVEHPAEQPCPCRGPIDGVSYARTPDTIHKQWGGNSYHNAMPDPNVPVTTPGVVCVAIDALGGWPVYEFAGMHASQFGLLWMGNSDPPHFQPVELPRSRRQFRPKTHWPLKEWPLPQEDDMARIVNIVEVPADFPKTACLVHPGLAIDHAGVLEFCSADVIRQRIAQGTKFGASIEKPDSIERKNLGAYRLGWGTPPPAIGLAEFQTS